MSEDTEEERDECGDEIVEEDAAKEKGERKKDTQRK